MKRKRSFFARYVFLAALFIAFCLIYTARLIQLQISGQDYYTQTSASSYTYRTETIYAQRGEIYDCNGVPLVTNEYTYNMELDSGSMPSAQAEKNDVILAVLREAEAMGESDAFTLPDSPFLYFATETDGQMHFDYRSAFFERSISKRFTRLITELNCAEDASADEVAAVLLKRYGLTETDADGNTATVYDPETTGLLLTVRIDMELNEFSSVTPYTLLEDISLQLLSRIKESGIRGVSARTIASRAYQFPGYASHILGRVGAIQAAYVDYYTELGYPLDATVGISGAEQAFEEYLHGEDGTMVIVEDAYGNRIDQYVKKEAKAGANVYLTIDIQMQIVAEDALADNIQYIVEKGTASGEEYNGEDADTGALAAIDIETGAVLALASYPTYNLATFSTDATAIYADPLSPAFNRALGGRYPPGSTFKIGVAAAALSEGIITPTTEIVDRGKYEYYSTYQPSCWIYNQQGLTHGSINVTTAIQVSCNYFFYEIGRLLTIETMNRYCRALGLGVSTGIELNESVGVLAGPDYRNENELGAWNPGDTIAAAIGQSDNQFSPLQLSVYMSSIINNGTRMRAHLLDRVEEFYTGEILYQVEPEVADDSISFPDGVRDVLLNAMKSVTENGSAARVFSSYPIAVGGKTGTAQTSENRSDNALFTAFAPFNDPEIVVTCVIEKGANGTDAGFAVRDVFSYYFDVDSD